MSRHYKICFIGLGSIASRHITNIRQVIENRGDTCEVHVLRSGHGSEINNSLRSMIDRVCYSYEELSEGYDIAFVTDPTVKHYETIKRIRDRAVNLFIEKPVFHTSDMDIEALGLENKLCYVACPLRYTEVIEYLKENLETDKIRNIRVVSASYLPDWRPDRDYRKTYSASKELGGGVSIDLIHEWDYLTWIMGMPKKVISMISQVSRLELDCDDIAVYIADYGNCIAEVHLDYFSRETIRRIEITTDDNNIYADLVSQTIRFSDRDDVLSFSSERDGFQKKELEHFLDIMEGKTDNNNDMINALKVLAIAEGKV